MPNDGDVGLSARPANRSSLSLKYVADHATADAKTCLAVTFLMADYNAIDCGLLLMVDE